MVIPELCGPSTSTPDKQLNRQVFDFFFLLFEYEVPRLVEL